MPSGKIHTLINSAVYSVIAGGVAYLYFGLNTPLDLGHALRFSLGFWAGTVLLSPDLDLAEQNVDAKRAWGILGKLWEPYGILFSHRGLSHTWIIGPLTRLIYLALLVLPVIVLLTLLLPGFLQLRGIPLTLEYWSTTLAGYYLSQWLHLIADGIRLDHVFRLNRGAGRRGR